MEKDAPQYLAASYPCPMLIPPPDTVLSPSQLNALTRGLLEDNFRRIWIEGEIGNLSRPSSGHLYFTLKDDKAQVQVAMFRNRAIGLRFAPREGMRVLACGQVTLYVPRGNYQIVIEHLQEAGEGALQRAFEALKARLQEEGLFDQARKRPLPALPRRIAVLTSPDGAALHDVLAVLRRRFPLLEVDIFPVPVQGTDAAAHIRQQLARAADSSRHDLLLLTRGGGSLEDLWAFNDEHLVRSIAAIDVPVVSAIGHESDFTLTDFVADLRAPTPSAAAELITPDQTSLQKQLVQLRQQMIQHTHRQLREYMQQLDQLALMLIARSPDRQLALLTAQQNTLRQRLDGQLAAYLQRMAHRLQQVWHRLNMLTPTRQLELLQQRLAQLHTRPLAALQRQLHASTQRLQVLHGRPARALQQCLHDRQQRLAHWANRPLAVITRTLHSLQIRLEQLSPQPRMLLHQQKLARQHLEALRHTLEMANPLNTLTRGYSILSHVDGQVVRSIRAIAAGDMLEARLGDGRVHLQVIAVHPEKDSPAQ